VYTERLEEAIAVYGIANTSQSTVPARRDKQARLILKSNDTNRLARAGAILDQAYVLHRKEISELERQLVTHPGQALLQRIITAEMSLGAICKTLERVPSQHQAQSARELQLTRAEMSKNSQRHLAQLTQMTRQDIRSTLVDVFSDLKASGRYLNGSDEIVSRVNAQPGPDCEERLNRNGRWSLLRSQMRLGRKDPMQPSLITEVAVDSSQCNAELRYPVSGIISARAQRAGLSKLNRKWQRVFGR
jgi:hypothetical protein